MLEPENWRTTWRVALKRRREVLRESWAEWREAWRETLKALRATHFFRVAVLMVLLVFLASLAMEAVEPPDSMADIWDAVWWALVTVTTVGYGDLYPKTAAGRVIGVVVMVGGVFLVSLLTAAIASVFVSRKIKEGKGLEDVRDRDHLVVCGWNENGLALVGGLVTEFRPRVPVIVLVNELPREAVDAIIYRFPDITFRYVRGNFTKEEILARANVRRARAAIVLADTSGAHPIEKADERTIFSCLAIKTLAPKVKTCAELRNPENREHLRRAKVDEIVVRGEYNAALLVGAAADTGLATVMKRLLDVEERNKLWRARVPERLVGRTVAELAEHFQSKYAAILLAIVTETSPMRLEDILSPDASAIDQFIKRKFAESGKDYFASGKTRISVQINPPRDHVLTKHDAAIVLGAHRPTDSSILEKGLDLMTGSG